MAISAVSRSRISPTMMMSGSWRMRARRPSAKLKSSWGCTWVWLKLGSIISIGSSTVLTFTSSVATRFKVEYSVVVFPEPVGPVTRMMPCGRLTSASQRSASCWAKPRASRSLTALSGSKIRMTIFSPNAVGAPWFQVDVARALVKGILPEPVHHLDHALVVGVELLVALAQLHQLLEATAPGVAPCLLRGTHGLGQGKKLCSKPVNVQRAGHHAAQKAPGLTLHLRHPVLNEGLGRSHHHFLGGDLHGQHLVALCIGGAHGFGHAPHVHLERVDAQIGQARALGEVLGKRLDVQRLAIAGTFHGHVGQAHQRMLGAFRLRAAGD